VTVSDPSVKENHRVNTTTRRLAIAGVLSLSLIAAACGSDDASDEPETTEAAETTEAPETTEAAAETTVAAGGEVEVASGSVFVTGSSTVEPVSVRVSELAASKNPDLKVTVEGPGTGDGFDIFCGGDADVTGASRPIKDEELATCQENGIEPIEIKFGIDGLTVATSPNNSAIECLDTAALYALIGPESEGFDTWDDANGIAAELGSQFTSLPAAPLVISGPGEESGTYDSFVEFAIAPFAEDRGQEEQTRADYVSSGNDNLIVEGIEGSDTSLGWVGYAYYQAEGDRIQGIQIADDEGTCIAPTPETIADGSYPFSRPLFIYVNPTKAAENPAVISYVDLYLSDEGVAEVSDAGYVPVPADELQASRDAWTAAKG
jgi:phosphate transport system substrate-binding protein